MRSVLVERLLTALDAPGRGQHLFSTTSTSASVNDERGEPLSPAERDFALRRMPFVCDCNRSVAPFIHQPGCVFERAPQLREIAK